MLVLYKHLITVLSAVADFLQFDSSTFILEVAPCRKNHVIQ